MDNRTKELKLLETQIGVITLNIKGQERVFTVFYGGALYPWVDGNMLVAPMDKYEKILRDFVTTVGSDYIVPSNQKIAEDRATVINNYRAGLYRNPDAVRAQEEPEKQENSIEENKEEISEKENSNVGTSDDLINDIKPNLENTKETEKKEEPVQDVNHGSAKKLQKNVDLLDDFRKKINEPKSNQNSSKNQKPSFNNNKHNNFQDNKNKEQQKNIQNNGGVNNNNRQQNQKEFQRQSNTSNGKSNNYNVSNNNKDNHNVNNETLIKMQKEISELRNLIQQANENKDYSKSLEEMKRFIDEQNKIINSQKEALDILNSTVESQKTTVESQRATIDAFNNKIDKTQKMEKTRVLKTWIIMVVGVILMTATIVCTQLFLPRAESAITLDPNTDAELHIVIHEEDGTDTFKRVGSIVLRDGKLVVEE